MHRDAQAKTRGPETRLRLATVSEIVAGYPFTELGLRALIFRAGSNGLDAAILRIGRRVLLDLDAWECWLEDHRARPEGTRAS